MENWMSRESLQAKKLKIYYFIMGERVGAKNISNCEFNIDE